MGRTHRKLIIGPTNQMGLGPTGPLGWLVNKRNRKDGWTEVFKVDRIAPNLEPRTTKSAVMYNAVLITRSSCSLFKFPPPPFLSIVPVSSVPLKRRLRSAPISFSTEAGSSADNMSSIQKSEDEWRAVLSPEQFRILRQKGTE